MSAQKEWLNHRTRFLADNGERWPSPKAYFEAHGLNVNSGRREFTKIAKLEAEGLSHSDIALLFTKAPKAKAIGKGVSAAPKSDQKKRDQKKSDQRKSDQKKSDQKKSDQRQASKQPRKNNGLGGAKQPPQLQREEVIKNSLIRLTTPQHLKHRDDSSDQQIGNRGRFARGNAAAVRTGAYMDVMSMPKSLRDMVKSNCEVGGVDELVQLEETRYVYMNQLLFARLQALDDEEAAGIKTLDENGNEINPLERKARAVWGLTAGLGSTFSGLIHAHMLAHKTTADVQIKYSKMNTELDRADKLKAIVSARGENDSALDTVRQLEREGIKPPPLLVAEALKEIEMMAPKIDMSGISEAELDAAVAAYESTHAANLDIFKQRKNSIERMLLEAKASAELGGDDDSDFDYDGDDDDFEYEEPQGGEFAGLSDEALGLDDSDDDDDDADEWGDL